MIWVTGLSGAGKTTLCASLYDLLKPRIPELILLDGDAVRTAFGHDLTHRESDRVRQVKRLQSISKLLADQGCVVLVAVLYAHPSLLAWNRANLPGYAEIYLDASLDMVMARDDKELYARALTGELRDVVGIDIPWHAPEAPDVRIDVDAGEAPLVMRDQVIRAIPAFAATLNLDRTTRRAIEAAR